MPEITILPVENQVDVEMSVKIPWRATSVPKKQVHVPRLPPQ